MFMARPGDLILADARFAHWPTSPGGPARGGACPGRVGLTFMANTYLGAGFDSEFLPPPSPGS